MRKLLPFVAIVLGVLCLSSFSATFAEMMTSTVGVAKGDSFNYSYNCFFNSNDSNAVLPASFSWINQTRYFMIKVTEVSDSSVNFETTLHSVNGSSSIGVCSMNVGTGITSISGYGGPSEANNFYFMARNVGMMGRMFPISGMSPTINDTLMMNYASGSRLTNHYVTSTNQNGVMLQSDFYFDQATGMMVEWRQQTIQVNGNFQTNSTQMMKITSSSAWTIPEFPASIVFGVFLAGTIIVALVTIILGKRFEHAKEAS